MLYRTDENCLVRSVVVLGVYSGESGGSSIGDRLSPGLCTQQKALARARAIGYWFGIVVSGCWQVHVFEPQVRWQATIAFICGHLDPLLPIRIDDSDGF